jgi:hypothetical protein
MLRITETVGRCRRCGLSRYFVVRGYAVCKRCHRTNMARHVAKCPQCAKRQQIYFEHRADALIAKDILNDSTIPDDGWLEYAMRCVKRGELLHVREV